MPKAGFKSITISEAVYEKFYDTYDQSKTDLAVKGVRSFSGYITYMLEEMMQKDNDFCKICSIAKSRVQVNNDIRSSL